MNIKSCSIIICIATTISLLFFIVIPNGYKKNLSKSESTKKGTPHYSIAIITPVSHPSLEKIEKSFKETLKKENSAEYRFTTYNANGNQTLLRAQIEEALQQHYDLLFTIATHPTVMAKELTAKRGIKVPIVFAAVANPVSINIITSIEHSENNVVGSIEVADYEQQLTLLKHFKPNLNNLLLVYNPSQGSGLERNKDRLEVIAKKLDIQLVIVPVYETSEVYGKTQSACSLADAIIVLKDNTVVSALDSLIKLCNQHKIPLIASDLDSVEKGAAFGFGVHESDFGVISAQLARSILEDEQQPSNLASVPVTNFKLGINERALKKLGV